MTDPYDVLGIERNATTAEVKRAYRKAALRLHPDHGGGRDEYDELQRARDVLLDEERRARYDSTGEMGDVGPDNARSDALAMICGSFDAVMAQIVGSGGRPEQFDLVSEIRQHIVQDRNERARQKADVERSFPNWKGLARRFKVAKGQNVIATMIEQKCAILRDTLAQIERFDKATPIALELLKDYSFDREAPEPFVRYVIGSSGTTGG